MNEAGGTECPDPPPPPQDTRVHMPWGGWAGTADPRAGSREHVPRLWARPFAEP